MSKVRNFELPNDHIRKWFKYLYTKHNLTSGIEKSDEILDMKGNIVILKNNVSGLYGVYNTLSNDIITCNIVSCVWTNNVLLVFYCQDGQIFYNYVKLNGELFWPEPRKSYYCDRLGLHDANSPMINQLLDDVVDGKIYGFDSSGFALNDLESHGRKVDVNLVNASGYTLMYKGLLGYRCERNGMAFDTNHKPIMVYDDKTLYMDKKGQYYLHNLKSKSSLPLGSDVAFNDNIIKIENSDALGERILFCFQGEVYDITYEYYDKLREIKAPQLTKLGNR